MLLLIFLAWQNLLHLQERFAGIKLSRLARSVIADTMMMSAWTSAAILDRYLSWIRLRITQRKVAVGNTRRNAGTQCMQIKRDRIHRLADVSLILICHECNYAFAVLVKDPVVQVKRASSCPSLIESSVEPNQTVATILRAMEGPLSVQRRYRKPTRLDAMRALK